MKKINILLISVFLLSLTFQSCSNSKTYAEQKKDEKESIQRYIEKNNINVITLNQFLNQDTTTNVANNEYVLFDENGVYMQVINRGDGEIIEDGSKNILARYVEEEIALDGTTDTLSLNTISNIATDPDEFRLTVFDGSFSGTFISGIMSQYYSSAVPAGWLVPFKYIKVGRAIDKRTKLKLIVPHSQGQITATGSVYACVYEITYQLE